MPPKTLTIGLVQQSCSADRDANLATSLNGIRELAGHGAQLILLSELHAMPYPCQTENADLFDWAEP
ncbi:MAG: acyltransferase, partial [Candidatus Competibacter sp.]|nr:acyltransferase [Candidatus Competibacter sp.]